MPNHLIQELTVFDPILAAELAHARHDDLIRQAEQARLVRTARDARRAQRRPRTGWWSRLARLLHRGRHRIVLPTTAPRGGSLQPEGGRGAP